MRIGCSHEFPQRPKKMSAALVKEKHQVGQPLGKAHIVRDNDARFA
jgi:hypothetical protein